MTDASLAALIALSFLAGAIVGAVVRGALAEDAHAAQPDAVRDRLHDEIRRNGELLCAAHLAQQREIAALALAWMGVAQLMRSAAQLPLALRRKQDRTYVDLCRFSSREGT